MVRKIIIFASVLIFTISCREGEKTNKVTFSGLGTVLSVIYSGEKNPELEEAVKNDAKLVENELSYYKKDSFVSQINTSGSKDSIKVPEHVCRLIDTSLKFGKNTDGAFDITYKSQGILWKKNADKIPTEEQLREKKDLVGTDLVVTDCEKGEVKTLKEGVLIDLGGIAKGYAIDRAGDIFKKNGYRDFIINYGGDMLVCGSKGKKQWTVGIRNPEKDGKLLKTLKFGAMCHGIATSGDYERFIDINGKKYSHIFDPGNGKPVKGASSVTVVAEDALTADAIATSVSVRHHDDSFIKKIVEKFSVKIYTLVEKNKVLKQW